MWIHFTSVLRKWFRRQSASGISLVSTCFLAFSKLLQLLRAHRQTQSLPFDLRNLEFVIERGAEGVPVVTITN